MVCEGALIVLAVWLGVVAVYLWAPWVVGWLSGELGLS